MLNVMNGSTNGQTYELQEKPYELANVEENLQPGQLEKDLAETSSLEGNKGYNIAFINESQAESYQSSNSQGQTYNSA